LGVPGRPRKSLRVRAPTKIVSGFCLNRPRGPPGMFFHCFLERFQCILRHFRMFSVVTAGLGPSSGVPGRSRNKFGFTHPPRTSPGSFSRRQGREVLDFHTFMATLFGGFFCASPPCCPGHQPLLRIRPSIHPSIHLHQRPQVSPGRVRRMISKEATRISSLLREGLIFH
jgi:hypothetical protein